MTSMLPVTGAPLQMPLMRSTTVATRTRAQWWLPHLQLHLQGLQGPTSNGWGPKVSSLCVQRVMGPSGSA